MNENLKIVELMLMLQSIGVDRSVSPGLDEALAWRSLAYMAETDPGAKVARLGITVNEVVDRARAEQQSSLLQRGLAQTEGEAV